MYLTYLIPASFRTYLKRVFALSLALATIVCSNVDADTVSFDFDVENFGNSVGTVFDQTFSLGEVVGIDFVSIELSHSFAADLDFTMEAPDGQTFNFTSDLGPNRALGDGGSTLAGTALYTFVEFADVDLGQASGDPIPAGTYEALEWGIGPWTNGNWRLLLEDDASGDDGAVGSVVVGFTTTAVPEPSAALLLVLTVLGLSYRRDRRDVEGI